MEIKKVKLQIVELFTIGKPLRLKNRSFFYKLLYTNVKFRFQWIFFPPHLTGMCSRQRQMQDAFFMYTPYAFMLLTKRVPSYHILTFSENENKPSHMCTYIKKSLR